MSCPPKFSEDFFLLKEPSSSEALQILFKDIKSSQDCTFVYKILSSCSNQFFRGSMLGKSIIKIYKQDLHTCLYVINYFFSMIEDLISFKINSCSSRL